MHRYDPGRFKMYKADSGAVRFKLRYPAEHGQGMLSLISKTRPKRILYDITIGPVFIVLTVRTGNVHRDTRTPLPGPMGTQFTEFWLTWHSCAIRLGVGNHREPLVQYKDGGVAEYNIGYIKFFMRTSHMPVEWDFEASPVILRAPKEKKFEDDLQWKRLTVIERNGNMLSQLPEGAMIGGFENEPTYIARTDLFGSLCIGKYVPSKSRAFFPWGKHEHSAQFCEILCGMNAQWIKTRGNYIPENAFVGGFSEVHREPLYVGRAMHKNRLLVGKVHTLYAACYLPYRGKELCVGSYEILTKPNAEFRGKLVRQKKTREQLDGLDPLAQGTRRHLIRILRVMDALREQQIAQGGTGRPLSDREIQEALSTNRIPFGPRTLQGILEFVQMGLVPEPERAAAHGAPGGAPQPPPPPQAQAEGGAPQPLPPPQAQAEGARRGLGQHIRQRVNILFRPQRVRVGGVSAVLQRGPVAQRPEPMPQIPLGVAQMGPEEAQRAHAEAQAPPLRVQIVAQVPERYPEELQLAQQAPQGDAQAAQEPPQEEGVAEAVERDLRIHPWGQGFAEDLRVPQGQDAARDLRAWQQGPAVPQEGQEVPRDLRVAQDMQQALEMLQEAQRVAQGGQPAPQEAAHVAALPQEGLVVLPPAVGVRISVPQAAVGVQHWGVALPPRGLGMPLGAVGVQQGDVRMEEPPPAHGYQVGVIPPPAAHGAVPAVPYPGRDQAYWAYMRYRYPGDMPYNYMF